MKAEVPVSPPGRQSPPQLLRIPQESLGPVYQSVIDTPTPNAHTCCIQLPNLNIDFSKYKEGLTRILQAWHLREELPTNSTF